MQESRKLERRRTNAFLGVYERSTEKFIGRLVDMTTQGVKLRSVMEMQTDGDFQFRMDLPFEIEGSMEITFDARSIWCEECNDSDEYMVGFEMQAVSPTDIRRISLLIKHPLFEDADERVNVSLIRKTN